MFSKATKDNIAELKKEIFTGIGSNYFLNDGKLMITLDELLLPIEKVAAEARSISKKLELPKKQAVTTDSGEIYSQNPKMLRVLDDVRTSLISISDLNWFRIVKTW